MKNQTLTKQWRVRYRWQGDELVSLPTADKDEAQAAARAVADLGGRVEPIMVWT